MYQPLTPAPAARVRRSVIQPELKVGRPNDRYEQEADAMANHVMSNQTGAQVQPGVSQGVQLQAADEEGGVQMQASEEQEVQMKCAACGGQEQVQRMAEDESVQMMSEEEGVQMMAEDESVQMMSEDESVQMAEEEDVQMKPVLQRADNGGLMAPGGISRGLAQSSGGGMALPGDVQADMGQKMGADFSNVKVHTDSRAVQMNQDLGAKAFTHSNHIYFNSGQYSPGTGEGKRLLAHELTHTIQQGASKNVQ